MSKVRKTYCVQAKRQGENFSDWARASSRKAANKYRDYCEECGYISRITVKKTTKQEAHGRAGRVG